VIYVKSLLAGLAALIITAALIIGLLFFTPIVMERLAPSAGGVSYVVNTPYVSIWPVLLGALFIFAAVSYWAFKRASRATGAKF
jgi:hypothetical protein